MFKIPAESMAILGQEMAKTFPERIFAFVQRNLPKECKGDVRAQIKQALSDAAKWGFVLERDVATYVVLTFALGPHFDEAAWAKEILAQIDVSAHERIATVYETAIRRSIIAHSALSEK